MIFQITINQVLNVGVGGAGHVSKICFVPFQMKGNDEIKKNSELYWILWIYKKLLPQNPPRQKPDSRAQREQEGFCILITDGHYGQQTEVNFWKYYSEELIKLIWGI